MSALTVYARQQTMMAGEHNLEAQIYRLSLAVRTLCDAIERIEVTAIFAEDEPKPSVFTRDDWHPLAWELTQLVKFDRFDNDSGGVRASLTMRDGSDFSATGFTTTDAQRQLARKLTRWAEQR